MIFLGISFEGSANIKAGETARVNGKVKFHPSIQLVKWQKYHNNRYIDINIHKPKYKGSTNDIANPILEIHDFDTEDEVTYRLEVITKQFKIQSYVHRLESFRISGAVFSFQAFLTSCHPSVRPSIRKLSHFHLLEPMDQFQPNFAQSVLC